MTDKKFNVFIYQNERRYLEWLVLQRPNIETGGDLFGLWRDKNNAVVQLVLGPGNNCKRATYSFHQDVQYLEDVGKHLTTSHGLCNIGEWHSHHRIGLAEPSGGDRRTVWQHMDTVIGGRFMVFIANIRDVNSRPTVKIGCFMFVTATGKVREGSLKELPENHTLSPFRLTLNKIILKQGAEVGTVWEKKQFLPSQTSTSNTTGVPQRNKDDNSKNRSEVKTLLRDKGKNYGSTVVSEKDSKHGKTKTTSPSPVQHQRVITEQPTSTIGVKEDSSCCCRCCHRCCFNIENCFKDICSNYCRCCYRLF